VNVNHIDITGEAPIHGAAACGHTAMVRYLISVGAQLEIPGTTGLTPLHWAAGWGNLDTVKALMEAGADVNARTDFGLTPEQVAVQHNQHEISAHLRTDA
jgi:hypothetical protein